MLSLTLLAGGVGYLAALQRFAHQTPMAGHTALLSENVRVLDDIENRGTIDRSVFRDANQWGQMQAEIIKLSVLFKRLAALVKLDDAEFQMDIVLGADAEIEPLSPFARISGATDRRFVLAKQAVTHMSARSGELLSILRHRQRSEDFSISGVPVENAEISSKFGYRLDPRAGSRRLHRGIDFSGKPGTQVLALADGVVTYSGKNGGYGNLVELEHADGYRTRYAHNEANLVRTGRHVRKGQPIATMGSTGRSTGTHVHVEVHHHSSVLDPLQFIR